MRRRVNLWITNPAMAANRIYHGSRVLLEGQYPITATMTVNKAGVTIKGANNALTEQQGPVIVFLVTAAGVSLDGLVITSDISYAQKEFIQFGSNYGRLLNSVIFGLPQAGDFSTWIVNRGFVTQGVLNNIVVHNNILYSLRQPACLNPNSSGG